MLLISERRTGSRNVTLGLFIVLWIIYARNLTPFIMPSITNADARENLQSLCPPSGLDLVESLGHLPVM